MCDYGVRHISIPTYQHTIHQIKMFQSTPSVDLILTVQFI